MVAVCLVADSYVSIVDFPRFITIVNTPFPIFQVKISLKSLPHTPFLGLIFNNKHVMKLLKLDLTDW
jgi:hypothetical protein